MWKIKFNNEGKTVERFNNKATVVTINAEVLADNLLHAIPYQYRVIGKTGNIVANVAHEAIYITAKGKAVRSDKDKDNPVLGEKIAECKAKMRIFRFMVTLLDKSANYYGEKLVGKRGSLIFEEYDNDSIYGNLQYYKKLWDREYRHWIKLLTEAGKWD